MIRASRSISLRYDDRDRELAETIKHVVGYPGEIVWTAASPTGDVQDLM
jgi:hypothetical protein